MFLASGLLLSLANGEHQEEIERGREMKSRVVMGLLCALTQGHIACQSALSTLPFTPVVVTTASPSLNGGDSPAVTGLRILQSLCFPCLLHALIHLCKKSLYSTSLTLFLLLPATILSDTLNLKSFNI